MEGSLRQAQSAGLSSGTRRERQETLYVLKVSSMRLMQGFFAGCFKQDDFVSLAAALQVNLQIQPRLAGREPLIVRETLQLHQPAGSPIVLNEK
jgi:hypothetical protein